MVYRNTRELHKTLANDGLSDELSNNRVFRLTEIKSKLKYIINTNNNAFSINKETICNLLKYKLNS